MIINNNHLFNKKYPRTFTDHTLRHEKKPKNRNKQTNNRTPNPASRPQLPTLQCNLSTKITKPPQPPRVPHTHPSITHTTTTNPWALQTYHSHNTKASSKSNTHIHQALITKNSSNLSTREHRRLHLEKNCETKPSSNFQHSQHNRFPVECQIGCTALETVKETPVQPLEKMRRRSAQWPIAREGSEGRAGSETGKGFSLQSAEQQQGLRGKNNTT